MKTITVVYHSGFGHTHKLAEAVLAGLQTKEGIDAKLIPISQEGELNEHDWETLDKASAIVMGSPTYMGMVSWQFKKFADTSSQRWFNSRWKDKLAAGFTNSAAINGDKASTLSYLMTFALQHAMVWVGNAEKPAADKTSQRNDINYLGSYSGLMGQSPSDSSPDEGPLPGDLDTAKCFGKRIADLVTDGIGVQAR